MCLREKPLRAGASFVPSPVTATTSPLAFNLWKSTHNTNHYELIIVCTNYFSEWIYRLTRLYLSIGDDRARTWRRGKTSSISWDDIVRNWDPSKTSPPAVKIPHSFAIFMAVWTSFVQLRLIFNNHACWELHINETILKHCERWTLNQQPNNQPTKQTNKQTKIQTVNWEKSFVFQEQ
jgi:hypothetical protein